MAFVKWLHHLFNPHCPDCIPVCESCNTLKMELARANIEKERLLQAILDLQKPPVVNVPISEPPKIDTKNTPLPWRVRQQLLETEDRERARLIQEVMPNVTVGQLEKELGINDAISTSDAEVQGR